MRKTVLVLLVVLFAGCKLEAPKHVTVDVMSPVSSVKYQGEAQLCWAYAMLAAVETEHFRKGDSLDLPIEPVVQALAEVADAPSQRAMGPTFLNLVRKYGIYSDVCSPDDFTALCSTSKEPYGEWVVLDVPDNWEHNRFLNLPADSLLALVQSAVRDHRGVCWEGDISERGFSFKKGIAKMRFPNGHTTDDHCMAIVGIAHDEHDQQFFVMKNSWGPYNPYGGYMLMSFKYFKKKTIAVVLPADAI
ncbi:MAG: hypothetical protein IJM33_07075 [Bacteroidales bacterium]|nr:hypothetical protein [Bacteroidales bacterium]MBR3412225.1 hypothetical protein [Bacteroidales bacterium]